MLELTNLRYPYSLSTLEEIFNKRDINKNIKYSIGEIINCIKNFDDKKFSMTIKKYSSLASNNTKLYNDLLDELRKNNESIKEFKEIIVYELFNNNLYRHSGFESMRDVFFYVELLNKTNNSFIDTCKYLMCKNIFKTVPNIHYILNEREFLKLLVKYNLSDMDEDFLLQYFGRQIYNYYKFKEIPKEYFTSSYFYNHGITAKDIINEYKNLFNIELDKKDEIFINSILNNMSYNVNQNKSTTFCNLLNLYFSFNNPDTIKDYSYLAGLFESFDCIKNIDYIKNIMLDTDYAKLNFEKFIEEYLTNQLICMNSISTSVKKKRIDSILDANSDNSNTLGCLLIKVLNKNLDRYPKNIIKYLANRNI